jgi:hypothetical protein
MFAARTFRLSAAAVAAAVAVGTVGAMPAEAGKPLPAPTGLAATATAHPNGTYDVAATWNAVANATSYRVSLTKSGATLSSATVSKTSWSPTVTATPGNASLNVRALAGRKPGKTATKSVVLLDVTPPQGAYSSSWDNNTGVATLTQDSLTDNAPVSGVTRTVDWNDGSGPEAWPSGTTINHTYPLTEQRYVPTVTLEDAAHNVRVVDAEAIVINDDEAPTGTFANETPTAWAAFTKVHVSMSDINDNWTPDDLIVRTVDWGDGTTTDWTTGATARHVYATAGSYTPVVTITDEAHNALPVSTSEVVVTADTTGPKVRLTLPKAKHSVTAWKTLRGKATDAETGVKSVWLKAVEKRGTSWFGYNAATHKWVKSASKAKAFSRAKAFTRTTNAQDQWTAKLAKLRKGTLVYKVRATDHVKNRSTTVTHKADLTKV